MILITNLKAGGLFVEPIYTQDSNSLGPTYVENIWFLSCQTDNRNPKLSTVRMHIHILLLWYTNSNYKRALKQLDLFLFCATLILRVSTLKVFYWISLGPRFYRELVIIPLTTQPRGRSER